MQERPPSRNVKSSCIRQSPLFSFADWTSGWRSLSWELSPKICVARVWSNVKLPVLAEPPPFRHLLGLTISLETAGSCNEYTVSLHPHRVYFDDEMVLGGTLSINFSTTYIRRISPYSTTSRERSRILHVATFFKRFNLMSSYLDLFNTNNIACQPFRNFCAIVSLRSLHGMPKHFLFRSNNRAG